MDMRVFPTASWHVRDVIAALRHSDKSEIIAAYGAFQRETVVERWLEHVSVAEMALTFFKGAFDPVALFTALPSSARGLHVNLVATDGFDVRFGLRVARHCRTMIVPALIARGYTRLECRVHEDHEKARRFIDFCGFEQECRVPGISIDGNDFIQMALVAEPATDPATEKSDVFGKADGGDRPHTENAGSQVEPDTAGAY